MGWDPFGKKAAKDIKKAAAAAAEAAKEAAEANAKAFRFNAKIYERNADVVEEQSYIDEARNRRAGSRFMGEQEAAIAGSGFRFEGFGDLLDDTAQELDLDAIIIRRQGQFRAADFEAQADLALMNADAAIKAGEAQAKMAILNGNAQASAAQSSAISGTIGLGISAAGVAFSDARIKTNIERVGQTPNGLGVFTFHYVWGGPLRIGVMAQEVAERFPDAVAKGQDGILTVDYSRIGLPDGYTLAAALKTPRRRLL
jgi:hypothetical protein